MRALITLLAAIVILAATATSASAASTASTISFRTSAYYSSIFGGQDSGTASFSGSLNGTDLSRMRGTLDLGIASYNLTVDPNGAAVIGDQDLQVGWFLWQCGMFGCTYTSGMSTYTHNVGNVPVDVRFGQLRGYGTLTWAGPATCSASCPPPGANVWYVPQPYSQLTAAVSSKDEAGTLNLYGPGPLIQ